MATIVARPTTLTLPLSVSAPPVVVTVKFCPTVTVPMIKALESVIEHCVPIVPTFTFQANLADYGAAVGASDEIRTLFQKEIEESAVMLRRAYDAGVPLLCGTESGFSLTPYGDWHYRELEIFVRNLGFSPLEAITASTSANAFAIGLEGETGALEVGRLADVIIVDGDVVKDVSLLGERDRIRHVILGGQSCEVATAISRVDPPGWRATTYGSSRLTRAMIDGLGTHTAKPGK